MNLFYIEETERPIVPVFRVKLRGFVEGEDAVFEVEQPDQLSAFVLRKLSALTVTGQEL